jgi:hypothetical protein
MKGLLPRQRNLRDEWGASHLRIRKEIIYLLSRHLGMGRPVHDILSVRHGHHLAVLSCHRDHSYPGCKRPRNNRRGLMGSSLTKDWLELCGDFTGGNLAFVY